MPASLAAVLVGAFLGLVLRLAGAESAPTLHSLLFFNEELFLYILLPPIIFEAGFSVSGKIFINNFATIFIFAVPGTLLTAFFVGQACQLAGAAGAFRVNDDDALDFTVSRDAYTFGALISATDPVATLSIMGAYQVDPLMYTLVAGESVLNDAVAIVLVRILQALGPAAFQHPSGFAQGMLQFVKVSLGSIFIGLMIALPSAALLRRIDTSSHGGGFELSLLLLLGYCAYPTAEAVHCSGILSLFVCSVLMGHYHVHSLSPRGHIAFELTLKSIAHLTETFVFMYMGMDLVAQRGAVDDVLDDEVLQALDKGGGAAGGSAALSTDDQVSATRYFVAFAILIVPIARMLIVPPLVLVANCIRGRKRSLSLRETGFLVFAGLRGAIAYALARSSASAHQRSIVAATTAVVLFTTFVLGGTTGPMLRLLGMIDVQGSVAGDGQRAGHEAATPSAAPPLAAVADEARNDGGKLVQRFHRFDARCLQPIFGGPGVTAEGAMAKQPKLSRARSRELQPITAEENLEMSEDADGPSDQ